MGLLGVTGGGYIGEGSYSYTRRTPYHNVERMFGGAPQGPAYPAWQTAMSIWFVALLLE